jgi:hypothetical protein
LKIHPAAGTDRGLGTHHIATAWTFAEKHVLLNLEFQSVG